MDVITTFPNTVEFRKAKSKINELGLRYSVIDPGRAYSMVGIPSIKLDPDTRLRLAGSDADYICSGWVDCLEKLTAMPADESPLVYGEDIFGRAAIMVLAPCVADPSKIRLIAHTEKDISVSFPYVNSQMDNASYNKEWPVLSFMDGFRMISLYQNRITIAKADDIVDAWRLLEKIRQMVNNVYAFRNEIEPSYEMRRKPPVLEIFKRLPGTNCRECGEATCMAFASRVWSGDRPPSGCKPVMEDGFTHLKDAYIEICAGMGIESLP